MSRTWLFNHTIAARLNPRPYSGRVEHRELGLVPVQQAAEQIACGPLLNRIGNWVLTEFGIECLRLHHPISAARLWERDWEAELRGRAWFTAQDEDDFAKILRLARQRWPREHCVGSV